MSKISFRLDYSEPPVQIKVVAKNGSKTGHVLVIGDVSVWSFREDMIKTFARNSHLSPPKCIQR